jgi:hypothetical protein
VARLEPHDPRDPDAYELVKAQEARVPRAAPHMNVRMVVSGVDDADPRCVGAMLHPEQEALLGAAPGTPAADVAPELLAELMGMRWATAEERNALQVMRLDDDAGASAVDGAARANAIRRAVR